MQRFTSAQKCPGARQQFTEIERLDEIIVGAGVESYDSVLDRVPCCEHQDWKNRTSRAHLAAHLKAIFARQHDIQNHQIIVVDARLIQRHLPVRRDIYGVALLAQSLRQHLCGRGLVFYQQDAHFIHTGFAIVQQLRTLR